MNKVIYLLSIIFLLSLSSASLGTLKYNTTEQLYQSCPTCSYVTLTAIKTPTQIYYPNINMTKNGSNFVYNYSPQELGSDFYYIVEGDKEGLDPQSEKIDFEVTLTGEEYNPYSLGGSIILILAFASLIFIFDKKNKEIDFEKMRNRVIEKYPDNLVKRTFLTLGYTFLREKYVIIYAIGFPILLLLTNLSFILNISAVASIMKVMLTIYTYGGILVGIIFLGRIQEIFSNLYNQLQNLAWGIK